MWFTIPDGEDPGLADEDFRLRKPSEEPRDFGEPRGGTGGGTFCFTTLDLCLRVGNCCCTLEDEEGAVVTIGLVVVDVVIAGVICANASNHFIF